MKKRWFAIDTETTGLDVWHGARPFSAAWYWDDGTSDFIRWKVDPYTREVLIDRNSKEFKKLERLLSDEKITKVFHNAKFDIRMFASIGLRVKGRIEDTRFAMFCVRNNLNSYGLKDLGVKFLDVSKSDETALRTATMRSRNMAKKRGWKVGKHYKEDYWLAPPQLLEKYNRIDAERTALLWMLVDELLDKENVRHIYEKEMKLLNITYNMEASGVRIDMDVVNKEIAHLEAEEKKYKKEIFNQIKKEINIDSPKQVAELFYKELKLPITHKTEKGEPSVNTKALASLDHPLVRLYEQCQGCQHALRNFFYKYKNLAVKEDKHYVLHPDFQQIGPITGRYACRNPNLQNVANALTTRSRVAIQARTPFKPRDGYNWYCFDYSQIELWIFALLSKEKILLNALLNGRDLHGETANHVWGNGKDIVAEEKQKSGKSTSRAKAKMLLFGKIYGIGVRGVMDLVCCSEAEAKQYLDEFDKAFPTITKFMQSYSRQAELDGYIKNVYGRKYFIDPKYSYRAVNYLVQGTAADLLKEKMIETTNYLESVKVDARLIMTIHDELVFEIRKSHATKNLLRKIKSIMEDNHNKFEVPRFKVKVEKVKENWSIKETVVL